MMVMVVVVGVLPAGRPLAEGDGLDGDDARAEAQAGVEQEEQQEEARDRAEDDADDDARAGRVVEVAVNRGDDDVRRRRLAGFEDRLRLVLAGQRRARRQRRYSRHAGVEASSFCLALLSTGVYKFVDWNVAFLSRGRRRMEELPILGR